MQRKAGPTLLIVAAALAFGGLALRPSAQEYYEEVRAGSPPTGGRIPIPNGSWYPALGPVSKWAYDWQGVTTSNNGYYGILLWALMVPAFVDRDELWAVEDGNEYLLGYYYDETRAKPFSWEKWGLADGNLNDYQTTVPVFWPGFTPGSMQINLSIGDKPLWWCYWDGEVPATGSPNQVWLYIYPSHLSRDEANKGQLDVFPGSSAANCMMAANHAWDGDYMDPTPITPPWGGGGMWWAIYDSTGYLATDNPAEINFSFVKRGDVVIYRTDEDDQHGYLARHIETFVNNGTDGTWGTNTAVSVPGNWWCHSSVVGYICHYFSNPPGENCAMIAYQHWP